MEATVMPPAQANLKLTLWNAEAESIKNSDLYIWLQESGLPSEVAIRMLQLISTSAEVGGRLIHVGKIILIRIIDFVKENSNLVIGVAVGAAIGSLINAVPFLGSILMPISVAFGATVGAIAGHRIDKANQSQSISTGLVGTFQDVIEIANSFFRLLIDVFKIALTESKIATS